MNGLVPCKYFDDCGDRVNPNERAVWRRVLGWEQKGLGESRRGGSDIKLRVPVVPPEYLCDRCFDRLSSGLSPAQEALL